MVEIGESIVGAYFRQIQGCALVTFNQFLPDRQGEIDVIALNGATRTVWLCEVTTHIQGFLLDGNKTATAGKINSKLATLSEYAQATFPDADHRFQWWSPYVPLGWRTSIMNDLENLWAADGRSLQFVINDAYTDRIRELYVHAALNPSATADPSYRMLQILSRLRGGGLTFN